MVFNRDVFSYTVFTNGRRVGKNWYLIMKMRRFRITNSNFWLIVQFQSTYNAVISFLKGFHRDFYCNRFLRMSLSSKVYRCVPLCNQTGYIDPQGNRVGFFLRRRIQTITSNGYRKSEKMLALTFH